MIGTPFTIPSAALRWRPRPSTSRHLRHLHSAAIGFVEGRSKALIEEETAHGLEQQLIEALVKSLANGSAVAAAPATREHREVAFRFEALLQAEPERAFRTEEICAALGVSAQSLHLSCEEQLGMGPIEYARRRRMQLVHRSLRRGNCETASIANLARRYGFHGLGHFAADYRALYGELPSATLRRGLDPAIAHLQLRRPRRPM
jgi:AraC family ethanolamine operon transcriptional activator